VRKTLAVFLLLTFTGPLWIALSGKVDFDADYRTANRESSHLAPLPSQYQGPIVQVYVARAFNWRGVVALHSWLAIKNKNGKYYTVYQVVGWNFLHGLPALTITKDLPDRYWFNQKPSIILDIRDESAEKIIPKILAAVKTYPYANEYAIWPGPNSNTFMAYIARHVPDMQLALPSNALGKDYVGDQFIVKAPSGTGYQFTIYGGFGIMAAVKEGVEINILGLVYGISPVAFMFKLPGFGDISVKPAKHHLDKQ
jgi:hypothetical protein